jgi:TRAP-type C4-dicarboxylate transport system permease large subunit
MDCEVVNMGQVFMHGFFSGLVLQLVWMVVGWIFSADKMLSQVTR